jgi:plasmid stabilization system protein ParE
MNLKYTKNGTEDLENAFLWYQRQRNGLGFAFLECVEAASNGILLFPEMYEKVYGNFRRCLIRRFPFSIFYTVEQSEIILHAILDNRINPEKWPK